MKKVTESWDNGSLTVWHRRTAGEAQVVIEAEERAMATARLHLTVTEVDALIDALIEARAEILGTPA